MTEGVDAQTLTAVGTAIAIVIGALIAHLSGWFLWRGQRADRWDEQRLLAYSDFLSAVLRTQRWWLLRLKTESKKDLIESVPRALDEVTSEAARLNLLASEPVKRAGQHLLTSLEAIVTKAASIRESTPRGPWSGFRHEAFSQLIDEFVDRRNEFEDAAQEELEIG